ncbi:MAG: AlwI family type II restriction endonuclease [Bacteroidales bacterium]|nr:AlwI family type II restriction endonuclease [Bacteroidales bacterium]
MEILTALKDFNGIKLDKNNLLNIVSHLYLEKIVKSDKIKIDETTTIDDIKELVIEVNSTRNSDGGFPKGYPARFWTYMRTLSELGFVYARYGEVFRFSEIAKKLVNREIDEQEAFSIQSMKYNRKNPYRNVSNDFNFFRFILQVLLKLREKGHSLSYEQFIVAMFSKDGNIDNFLKIIYENFFPGLENVYDFVRKKYGVTTKFKTVTRDYPDVVRRVLIISGFITIRYDGKKLIQINENKLDYINDLLSIDFELTEMEKIQAKEYFEKLDSINEPFIKLILKYREQDKINGENYRKQISSIIKTYEIDEKKITESINKIGSRKTVIEEFKEIPEPLKLEFFIAILITLKYGEQFAIRPNYKADHIGKPYSHAPGNKGDIEIFSKQIYWLIEVTLIRNKTQQLNNETTSVIRHLYSNEEFADRTKKYLSFVAPVIHQDVREFFNYSIVQSKSKDYEVNLKPYEIEEFVKTTCKNENFEDMEQYTQEVIEKFRKNLN